MMADVKSIKEDTYASSELAYSHGDDNGDVPRASHFIVEGDVKFVGELGGNGGGATVQDAWGAPVESKSPLGYEVGWWSALFLNITMLIGTGIFSFRKCHFQCCKRPCRWMLAD